MIDKEEKLEYLYGITKKAYGKVIDLKMQLEFLMKQINDFAEAINEQVDNGHIDRE